MADYLRAYQQVTGGRLTKTLPDDAGLASRTAGVAAETPATRTRAASDALLTAGGWNLRRCQACGATVKVPPPLQGLVQKCLRCGVRLS